MDSTSFSLEPSWPMRSRVTKSVLVQWMEVVQRKTTWGARLTRCKICAMLGLLHTADASRRGGGCARKQTPSQHRFTDGEGFLYRGALKLRRNSGGCFASLQ
eukprot:5653864-Amphidinium_carterae.1